VHFLQILPLAFVMIAGPQILTAIFLATSEHWARNTAAYLGGAALAITVVVSLAYWLSSGAPSEGGNKTVDVVVLVLVLAAMVHTFLTRKKVEPPKWMGKLETASPQTSFNLGFLMMGLFPGDILTSIAVGAFLADHDEPWWHLLPFLALTLLLLALPLLLVLVFGKRGRAFLPKARNWMNNHAWIVSEIVLVFFVVIVINGLAD
jgi:threonine/homoserine/homoserine lactone efflux protein